jgi:glycopeptide antibiotics resistance protein
VTAATRVSDAVDAGNEMIEGGGKKSRKSAARALWLLIALFVVYGTAIPFRFDVSDPAFGERLRRIDWSWISARNGNISFGDVAQNILLFIPFGFLGYISLVDKHSRAKILLPVLMGAGLSVWVEFLQVFSETRTPSLADVLTNTLGSALGLGLGIRLKHFTLNLKSHPRFRRWLDAESAFPALVFLGLAVVGCWGPFDFSLDPGLAWAKVKTLLQHPLELSLPNDDMANFIRFLLASLFASRLAKETGLSHPVSKAVGCLGALALGLEASQFIVQSRSPEFQDALISIAGVLAGGLAYRFPGFRKKPLLWGCVGVFCVFLAAVSRGLFPYQSRGAHADFQWIPFLPHPEKTALASLNTFMENALIYFPMGFLLAYFFRGSKSIPWISMTLAAAMAFCVEWSQGWITGRYADVTDVLGACLGSAAGIWAVSRGWRIFRAYLAETG